MYLVDSSIWIRVLRGRQFPQLRSRVGPLVEAGGVATNRAIQLEVLIGARTADQFEDYSLRFRSMPEFRVRSTTWTRASALGYRLGRAGHPMGVADLLIAASAIEYNAVLMHADADFDRIADHSDLQVESYVGSV